MIQIKLCITVALLVVFYLASSVLLSNLIFHYKANGSLIKYKNKIIGSKLIGQNFTSNKYFHSRYSAINYKSNISGSNNFPFYSDSLLTTIKNNHDNFVKLNKSKPDLNVLAESSSGLDPHITLTSTFAQIKRVSDIGMINKEKLSKLIIMNSKPRILGLFGERIVNVLELNIELDKLYAKSP